MRRLAFAVVLAMAGMLVLPASATAVTTTSYQYHLEVPNTSQDSHGDRVSVTGFGTFSENPKSVTGGGSFTHTFAGGGSHSGTWTADELLEFQLYGCGVLVLNGRTITLPPNFCGGALKMRVTLMPTGTTVTREGILTIFCIIGANPPNNHDDPTGEGITLVVPGVTNFNKIVEGMNVFIKQT